MQLCTSCVSLKTKKDRTFQLLLHRLPRAMSVYHDKTINVCRISGVGDNPQIPEAETECLSECRSLLQGGRQTQR